MREKLAWEGGKCRVPMWMAGYPAGFCGAEAFGPQYPRAYAAHIDTLWMGVELPYCSGPCCPTHGGPKTGEPIIFKDGTTEQGRPMWCAVMPGFVNLQQSPAGFSGNPVEAVKRLRIAVVMAVHDETITAVKAAVEGERP